MSGHEDPGTVGTVEGSESADHRVIYGVVIGVLVALLVVMLISFDYSKANAEAYAKADELIRIYEEAGLPVPAERSSIARVLGDDADVVCEPIGNGVDLGTLKSRLGVGGEFYFRATDVDEKAVFGIAAIVSVYCPDELDELDDFFDGFDFRDDLLDLD